MEANSQPDIAPCTAPHRRRRTELRRRKKKLLRMERRRMKGKKKVGMGTEAGLQGTELGWA